MRTAFLILCILTIGTGHSRAQNVEAGERVFAQCRTCHQVGEAAKNMVGPNLNGLFGRKSGSVEEYKYTEVNKNANITWDDATFREYIADPKGKMPGTKMIYAGLKNPKQIEDLMAYLKQFGATGKKAP